jgi:hypothetical protein
MTHDQYSVVIVYSTSHAVPLEKLLQGKGIPCKLIPVPRQISSDCGVCVRILRSDVEAVRHVIDAAHVEVEEIREI